jgi:hypothetical protein
MRTMLQIRVPVQAGNRAIKDGTLAKTMEALGQRLQPEASYFYPIDGQRAATFVFDMKDPSEIPQIAEALFANLEAHVTFSPVMNRDDLQKGLAATAKGSK